MAHPIRVGVGGWTFDPWNESFYPQGLSKKRQLEYASRQLTAIEINGTFYRLQKPDTFKKWADETPDGFMFTVKAHNFCMSRKTSEDMKTAVNNFIASGVTALGEKLGPINWQFHPSRKFDADYFKAFLGALPEAHGARRLRHALEVRDASFQTPAFVALLKKHNVALVSADDDDWPQPDVETADFAYARLQRTREGEKTGYPAKELGAWAKTLKGWAERRDVFAFFIAGAKARNPGAAQALIGRLGA
jgi:uncharacterized protein YecE (DUF72 family)